MSLRLREHAEARAELRDAAIWYDTPEAGLGMALYDAVDEALASVTRQTLAITANPAMSSTLRQDLARNPTRVWEQAPAEQLPLVPTTTATPIAIPV